MRSPADAGEVRVRPRGVVLALTATAVAVLIAAATAYAALTVRVDHPRDPSWGTIKNNYLYAVCDAQADGHETWLRIWQHGAPDWYSSPRDTYGRDAYGQYCVHGGVTFMPIRRVAICVSYEGCSPWKSITE